MPELITITLYRCIRGHKHKTFQLAVDCDNQEMIRLDRAAEKEKQRSDAYARRRREAREAAEARVDRARKRQDKQGLVKEGPLAGLTPRAVRVLTRAGLTDPEVLRTMGEAELLREPGLGRTLLVEINLWRGCNA